MSEAKQLPEVPAPGTQPEPAVFAEPVTGSSDSGIATALSGPETRGPAFTEKAASFFLRTFLLSAGFFALGATFAVLILMDLLDHKSGWIKGLLQFIKVTSKIFVK